jgi:hypothetical protein
MIIYRIMQKGFNSDVNFKGHKYHVQTEDWGFQNPYLVSRVFRQGAVLKTIKTPYQDLLKEPPLKDQVRDQVDVIQKALRHQHTLVVEKLLSGELV